VSAYTSDPAETDDTPNITASGTRTRDGIVACPRDIPFGTKVEIDGEQYVCEDRMNARYNNHFDIWMEHKEDALEWGRQLLEVKILK